MVQYICNHMTMRIFYGYRQMFISAAAKEMPLYKKGIVCSWPPNDSTMPQKKKTDLFNQKHVSVLMEMKCCKLQALNSIMMTLNARQECFLNYLCICSRYTETLAKREIFCF